MILLYISVFSGVLKDLERMPSLPVLFKTTAICLHRLGSRKGQRPPQRLKSRHNDPLHNSPYRAMAMRKYKSHWRYQVSKILQHALSTLEVVME
jgi:hypothetical protein